MKSKVLALLIPALLAAGAAHAAEVYNKDGKNQICMAKLMACIIFLIIQRKMATRAMRVWVLKAKPKLTINSLATVNGNTIFRQTTLNLQKTSHGPVWHLPG